MNWNSKKREVKLTRGEMKTLVSAKQILADIHRCVGSEAAKIASDQLEAVLAALTPKVDEPEAAVA